MKNPFNPRSLLAVHFMGSQRAHINPLSLTGMDTHVHVPDLEIALQQEQPHVTQLYSLEFYILIFLMSGEIKMRTGSMCKGYCTLNALSIVIQASWSSS